MAMATTLPPPRPVPVVEVVGTTVGVAAVEIVVGDTGSPGVNGFVVFVPCAAATEGRRSAAAGAASIRPSAMKARSRTGAYASGCSMAGVSGAST